MAIFPPLAWQEFVDDRVGAFYENTQNKFLANPPKELSPQELVFDNILGPYGKPDKNTIQAGKLLGGEHFLKFITTYPLITTSTPGHDEQTVLIKTNDGKIAVVEFLQKPICSLQRNQKQMDLMLFHFGN